jgi:hypothetical protein
MAIDRIPGVGPQNSDIAAAVAAPSAATIATQVAASVPTLSQINTSVSNNASPYGGTWATLVDTSFTAQSSVTISGLTGYKYLFNYLKITTVPSSSEQIFMRINGDSGSNYNNTNTSQSNQTWFNFGGNAGFGMDFIFYSYNSNSSTHQKIIHFPHFRNSSGSPRYDVCHWANTAAISSYTIWCNAGNFTGRMFIMGAN